MLKTRRWVAAALSRVGRRDTFHWAGHADSALVTAIAESGLFDLAYYSEQAGTHFARIEDAVAHYLIGGENHGMRPHPSFDPFFYRTKYPDLSTLETSLLGHYIEQGIFEGRQGSSESSSLPRRASARIVAEILETSLFNVDHYSASSGLTFDSPQSAAAHYADIGERQGIRPSTQFDPQFYVENYADLADYSGCLLLHYHNHGIAEGRMGALNLANEPLHGAQGFDSQKETVLIVAHEASRTGAPIVALNLAEQLQARFNVIVLLMRGGEITQFFLQHCHALYIAADQKVGVLSPEVMTKRILNPLLDRFKIDHVIANSVETNSVVGALCAFGLSVLSLVHEFTEYVFPKERMLEMIGDSARVVFSSALTEQSAREYVEAEQFKKSVILPQGRCLPPPAKEQSAAPIEITRIAKVKSQGQSICLGCGYVQIRKGVDLFLQTASYCRSRGNTDTLFVWVGDGYLPDEDYAYSVWLKDQVARSRLQDNFIFVPAVSAAHLRKLYQFADVMFLSSRLDPFPNVAIDALWEKLPIVCFESASGVAEYLAADPVLAKLVVPYLDSSAAANCINGLLRGELNREQIRARLAALAASKFTIENYARRIVEELEAIKVEARNLEPIGP